MILSLTVVPAAVAVFMNGDISEKESVIIVKSKLIYEPALKLAMKFRVAVVSGATLLVIFSVWLASTLGSYSVSGWRLHSARNLFHN